MLRQRTAGRGEQDVCEGIFIGDVEEPTKSLKDKINGQSKSVLCKYLFTFLIFVTGTS